MVDVLKCMILAVVVLLPMWLLAEELGEDEFVKSGAGVAAAAVILTALKIMESHFSKRNGKK